CEGGWVRNSSCTGPGLMTSHPAAKRDPIQSAAVRISAPGLAPDRADHPSVCCSDTMPPPLMRQSESPDEDCGDSGRIYPGVGGGTPSDFVDGRLADERQQTYRFDYPRVRVNTRGSAIDAVEVQGRTQAEQVLDDVGER